MEPSHAGGVVYRGSGPEVEYLLVGPSKENPDEWLLPKGHIRSEETAEDAAIREIHEETGVTARVKSQLDTVEFKVGNQIVRTKFYLMELISAGDSVEQRRRGWFALDAALARATHPQTKVLLKKAASRLGDESAANS